MTEEEMRRVQLTLLQPAIARLRASVMALVVGLMMGLGLLFATLWLVFQGGPNVGAHLSLLSNYYPGYTVTWRGAFLGCFYGMITGAIIGYTTTYFYNMFAFRRSRANDAHGSRSS